MFVVIYIDRYFDYENFDSKFVVLSSFSRKLCNFKVSAIYDKIATLRKAIFGLP